MSTFANSILLIVGYSDKSLHIIQWSFASLLPTEVPSEIDVFIKYVYKTHRLLNNVFFINNI